MKFLGYLAAGASTCGRTGWSAHHGLVKWHTRLREARSTNNHEAPSHVTNHVLLRLKLHIKRLPDNRGCFAIFSTGHPEFQPHVSHAASTEKPIAGHTQQLPCKRGQYRQKAANQLPLAPTLTSGLMRWTDDDKSNKSTKSGSQILVSRPATRHHDVRISGDSFADHKQPDATLDAAATAGLMNL